MVMMEPLKNSMMSCIRAKKALCQGASRRLHAVAIQRAEQHRQGAFLAEPFWAGLLRVVCCVKAFAKVSTFAAGFALHLISQKIQRSHHGVYQRFQAQRLWLVILLLACFLLPVNMANAALTASVDRTVVSKNDVIQLTIRSDKDPVEQVDFSALEKNFSIINKRRSNQISIINGHQQAIYDLTLGLFPKGDGVFTIPAFTNQGESSQAIQIKVSATTADSDPSSEQIFLKTEVNKSEVYVQEQVLYTLRLFHAVGLSEGQLSPLEVENAVVRPVGEQKKYDTVLNGIRYSVIEKQYTLIPEKSGQLSLPELVFTGRTAPNRSSYSTSGQYVRTRSAAHSIKVHPKPANYPATEPWLPTPALNITDSWNQTAPTLTVGEPVTRTLTVSALNLDAAQLPDLKLPSVSGLKMYPDQVQNENTVTAAGLVGQRRFATAIVPTKAGKLDIPASNIVWWNTTTHQIERSQLPARTITVLPAAQALQSSPPTGTAQPLKPASPAVNSETNEEPASGTSNIVNNTDLWPMISLLFALLWLATLYMWWRSYAQQPNANLGNTPAEPHQNLSGAFKALKKACVHNDASTTRQTLIHWCQLSKPELAIHNLNDVSACYQNPALTDQLQALERYLYGGPATTDEWQGATLLSLLKEQQKADKRSRKNQNQSALKPLYPL